MLGLSNIKERILFGMFKGVSMISYLSLDNQLAIMKKIVAFVVLLLPKKKSNIIGVNLGIMGVKSDKKEEFKTMMNLGVNILQVMQNYNHKTMNGKTFSFKNEEIIEKAIKANKKIIFITAHYGNWELLTSLISIKYKPMVAIYRALKHKSFDTYMKRSRENSGLMMYEKRGAIKELIKALKNDMPVGLLVDQGVSSESGSKVDFFLKDSFFIDTAATLSRMYGAVIIPVFIRSEDYKKYEIEVMDSFICEKTNDKEADIQQCVNTQALVLENAIKKDPVQWFLLHGRWRHSHGMLYKQNKKNKELVC